jgi:eukaryotic-like serine/threonine-protein kinase
MTDDDKTHLRIDEAASPRGGSDDSDEDARPSPESSTEVSDVGARPSNEGSRDSRIGQLLADRYELHRLIDTGAMGRVYEGHHVHMQKRVAIKVLHRELSSVPEFVSRFEREAMAAANIDSEHVAAATDFGKLPDGSVYLVLEYVEGRTLRTEVERGPMDEERALEITRQIALALRSAHQLGIVHRDLKPENVMLVERPGADDFAKVLDFGVARVPIGASTGPESRRLVTKTGVVFGTPEYMAPEQALGKQVDHRADLYSLGAVLYEMLAGRRPYDDEGEAGTSILGQQLSGVPPTIGTRSPNVIVHPGIERLALSLLDREPRDRPGSAQEVLDEIDRLRGAPVGRGELVTLQSEAPVGGEGVHSIRVMAARASVSARRTAEGVSAWLDGRRPVLPAAVRDLPAPVLLGVPAAAVALFLVGVLVLVTRSPEGPDASSEEASVDAPAEPTPIEAPSPGSPEPARAGEAELELALKKGASGVDALQERYPDDPALPLARAKLHLDAREYPAAVAAVARAVELDPASAEDAHVGSVMWVTAQHKSSTQDAFALLTGKLGERGQAILRDLAATENVRADVRERARKVLALAEE